MGSPAYREANLAAAAALAEAGLLIFPAKISRQGDRWAKAPCLKSWQSEASADTEKIEAWWKQYPHAVPGIELGRSGLAAIDADRHGGPDGVVAFHDLVAANASDLPPHPVTLTPGNGEHHVFSQPTGLRVRNGRGALPAGIDVRGVGGWIVAPGAVRPDGRLWTPAPRTRPLVDAYRDRDVPPLPTWCAKIISTAPHRPIVMPLPRAQAPHGAPPLRSGVGRESLYATQALRGISEELRRTSPNTRRNECLNGGSYRMGRMVARGWIDKLDVADELSEAAIASGLPINEVQNTLASGLTAGMQNPHEDLCDKGDAFLRDLLKGHQIAENEPTCRRYMATNASVEALGVLLQQNPNGLLVHRDEMLSLLDRLDEEGHADERGFYLTGWAGNSPYTFDRIGRGLDLHVEAVCLSMLGGTQPGRISQYLVHVRRGGRGDDGLIQRFGIMVWPDIPSNWNNVDRRPNREACDRAFRIFQALNTLDWQVVGAKRDFGSTGDEVGDPYLRFSPGAHERFLVWRMELERRLRHNGLHPALESHFAKYRKLVPALALICHLADSGKGDVSESAVEKALKWVAYLETHAARAYASTTIGSADAAHAIQAKIKSGHLKAQFSSRDVWRPQWSRLTDRETVQAALQLLVDYDWLSVMAVSTGGRTATVYTVNPKALTE